MDLGWTNLFLVDRRELLRLFTLCLTSLRFILDFPPSRDGDSSMLRLPRFIRSINNNTHNIGRLSMGHNLVKYLVTVC